jgi:Tol biopolymer transport system component
MDADGSNQHLLISTAGNGNQPVWSPDGQFITFYDLVGATGSTYVVDADGRNLRLLTTWNYPLITPVWVQQP